MPSKEHAVITFTSTASDFAQYGFDMCLIAHFRKRPVDEINREFEAWLEKIGDRKHRTQRRKECIRLAKASKLLPWEEADYQI